MNNCEKDKLRAQLRVVSSLKRVVITRSIDAVYGLWTLAEAMQNSRLLAFSIAILVFSIACLIYFISGRLRIPPGLPMAGYAVGFAVGGIVIGTLLLVLIYGSRRKK